MSEISFTSTYKIPLIEQHVTPAKRAALEKFASGYQNVLYPKGHRGSLRISIRKRLDDNFEQKLRQIGFKVYKKFARHNVPKTDGMLDSYINREIKHGNFHQFGKQKGC